jgi:guanylate kinase
VSKRKISSKGILFVVSAPSGAGKTTVVQRLLKKDKRLAKTISHTTRKPRPQERNGKDYYFVTKKAFRRLKGQGSFVETATVYGDYYGTSKGTIQRCTQKGKDAVLVIEAKGAKLLRRRYENAVYVSLLPPSAKELRRRMSQRPGSTAREIRKRLAEARAEVRRMHWYDYVVVNDRLSQAVEEVGAIVRAERKRMKRQKKTFSRFL